MFAHTDVVGTPVIDTHVSDSLKQVLDYLKIPKQGDTFHAFRRSGAIVAFGSHVNLEDIKAHSNWRSDAIFEYLRSDLAAPPLFLGPFSLCYSLGLVPIICSRLFHIYVTNSVNKCDPNTLSITCL